MAISIPDSVFHAAEALAKRMDMSRSALSVVRREITWRRMNMTG